MKNRDIKAISQPDIACKIMLGLYTLGVKSAEPRIINACIEAANGIYAELQRDPVMATAGMGLDKWLRSDDTGMSSRFMAYRIAGGPYVTDTAYPYDPDDFGRCVRFLEAVPHARALLHKMKDHGPVWAGYVDAWDKMETIYRRDLSSGKSSELYELMRSIQDAAKEPA